MAFKKGISGNPGGKSREKIFTDALRNSIGIGLISTTLAVILASSAAYAIARLDFPGKQIILTPAAPH